MNKHIKKLLILICLSALPFLGAYAQTVFQGKSKDLVTITNLQSNASNGYLSVKAQANNSNVHLYYRVVWKNEQGQQLAADAWKPILLLAKKSAHINATSPLNNATDFSLELKAD